MITPCLVAADWVVGDTVAPNYFATTLETISADDQLGLIEPRIHLTAVKPDERDGPDLNAIFVKVRRHHHDDRAHPVAASTVRCQAATALLQGAT